MRHWINESLHCLDKVATTDIVNEVKHNKRYAKLKADPVTEVRFIQESLDVLLLVYFVLLVDKIADLFLLFML